MDIVAIDILSGLPLPVTKDGHKYLLVATDYFTKWNEAYPLKDAEASTCMEALYNNCLLYTSPSPRDRQKSRMPSSA